MPLVAHNDLPTFTTLRNSGEVVLTLERAREQDIRELHIGFLNMMPDAALTATEQQFIRLVGSSNPIAQFYVYPFTLPELNRGRQAQEHVERYYFRFADLAAQGLDALIITGANVSNPSLEQEAFWRPLTEIADWAWENVTSIFCSCLATHALVKHYHGIDRRRLPRKQWGVYRHRATAADHPFLRDVNTRFDAPHSRYNEVTRSQMESAGLQVLAESEEAGVHLAVSPDRFRIMYFQGHPEYGAVSLLKEFKREVMRFLAGERESPPRVPENYLAPGGEALAREVIDSAAAARAAGTTSLPFPEDELARHADNTWGDTGRAIVNNWLGLVYQTTNVDRRKQFMEGIDPDDPLGLRG